MPAAFFGFFHIKLHKPKYFKNSPSPNPLAVKHDMLITKSKARCKFVKNLSKMWLLNYMHFKY